MPDLRPSPRGGGPSRLGPSRLGPSRLGPSRLGPRARRGPRDRGGIPWSVVAFGALSVAVGLYLAGSMTTSPSPAAVKLGAGDEAGAPLPPGPTGAVTVPTTPVAAMSSPPAPTAPAAVTPAAASAAAPSTAPIAATRTVRRAPAASPGTRGTAPAARPAPPATADFTCTYHDAFSSVGGGGFTASVTLRNTSTISLIGWDAQFDLSPAVTLREFWGANLEHTGSTVQVTPSYDVKLAAGASVSFGFTAATGSPVTKLGGFQLAGLPCRRG